MPRVIVYPPGHPLLSLLYTIAGLAAGMLALTSLASAQIAEGVPSLVPLVVALFLSLSPVLSWFNIVVANVETGNVGIRYEVVIVYNLGIPIPVPRLRLVRDRLVIAVNVGGAVVPVVVAAVLVYHASRIHQDVVSDTITATMIVALASYTFSRYVDGVGIVMPGLIQALLAGSIALLQAGTGLDAAAIAYTAGSIGSLIGADVLRLYKEKSRMQGLVSIGGAGVFDGVYMTGLLALLLVA